MQTNDLFESKLFRVIILIISGLIVLGFVFSLGIFVGTKQAEFSFKWADQYHRNFAGPQNGFFGDMMMNNQFTEGNGVFGQIIKINGQTLTIKGADNVEKNILINKQTSIVYQRKNISLSELKTDENVIVIGDPNNNGQIQAELIRVMPALPKNPPVSN